MSKYLFAYSGGSRPESESEQQAVMAKWMGWFGTLGDAVVDGGNPFSVSTSVGSGGSAGNGAGTRLTGYSLVKADSLEAASELAKGCPVLESGGNVDVYEAIEM